MGRTFFYRILLLTGLFLVNSCGGGGNGTPPEDISKLPDPDSAPDPVLPIDPPLSPPSGPEVLTDEAYNALSPLKQYQVANKLLGSMFKGLPAAEFFDVSTMGGAEQNLVALPDTRDFISKTRQALTQVITNRDEIFTLIVGSPATETSPATPGKYNFRGGREEIEIPLAYLYELPLSDEFYARWMAYKLTNTILFSPAEEIDSAFVDDVGTVFEELSSAILANAPIRSVIFNHVKSQTNWRRFRSSEDNTRATIEIYLGLFDRDSDVPKASIACRNWLLTDQDAGYMLKHPNALNNSEPQLIFDSVYITTCEDFYDAVSNHPLIISRVVTVLVNHFFSSDSDPVFRRIVTNEIVRTDPTTFRDIFEAIIFSRAYLLESERISWIEESFFNAADRIYWQPYSNIFQDLNRQIFRGEPAAIGTSIGLMFQSAFSLKYGRTESVPSDSLAMAYYQRAMRDALLVKNGTLASTWGWQSNLTDVTDGMSLDALVKYLFLSTLSRYPTNDEIDTLISIINTAQDNMGTPLSLAAPAERDNRALVILDYVSRLPELYYHKKIQ